MSLQNIINLPFPDLDMVLVEGGEFMMGDEMGDLWEACRPVHPVSVSSFYMAKFPVTQRLYQAVMGESPSSFKGDLRPVETVSWDDAQEFIEKLNAKKAVEDFLKKLDPPGKAFRLPTEAEWEFAARGGRLPTASTKYAGSDNEKEVAWYDENSYDETKAVGLKLPNELGLHDMSGNVWEWCEDDWLNKYDQAPADGSAWLDSPERGDSRVQRGGSYFHNPVVCRAAHRSYYWPEFRSNYLGFRLALSPQFSP